MRIVIDMQGAQTASRYRGIGRYTISLVTALVRNRGEHEIILLLNGLLEEGLSAVCSIFESLLPPQNILVWMAPDPVNVSDPDNLGREELAKILREGLLASLQADVVCISSFFEGYADNAVASIRQFDLRTPVAAITYDFIPLINPSQYLDHDPAYAHFYKSKVQQLSRANLLMSISESSRREAIEHLRVDAARVVNISAACDPCFKSSDALAQDHQALLARWGITRQYILYTGGADERKNLPRLIEAFARLPQDLRRHHQLLFAGKLSPSQKGELQNVARKQGLSNEDLCFTGFVSDDELVLAYSFCQLFVFPSWHEGFGLPPLEAMSCGAPVIAANTSSIPEVVGWPQALFDPLDVDAITLKMTQALGDNTFRNELMAHARHQSRKFSWDYCAITAIKAMENLGRDRTLSADQIPAHTDQAHYQSLLRACARVLRDHNLERAYDLSSLAASIAHNEAQARQYWQKAE